MGSAKLNIWVRDKKCRIVKRRGHLHIYNCNCLGEEVFRGWVIVNGHAEVEIPPGCYIVKAGMNLPHQTNLYTDRAVIIAKCNDEICLNLILPDFVEERTTTGTAGLVTERRLLVKGGCVPPVLLALRIEALRKGVDPKELSATFNVLMKTANIDRNELIREIEVEIEDTHQHLDEMTDEEAEDAREYMSLLEKIKDILRETKQKESR